jgi:hypothetical protein
VQERSAVIPPKAIALALLPKIVLFGAAEQQVHILI